MFSIFRLYGYKWFSSATDSDMTMTLARPNSSNNPKLSMFYLKTRDNQGNLNNIQVGYLRKLDQIQFNLYNQFSWESTVL